MITQWWYLLSHLTPPSTKKVNRRNIVSIRNAILALKKEGRIGIKPEIGGASSRWWHETCMAASHCLVCLSLRVSVCLLWKCFFVHLSFALFLSFSSSIDSHVDGTKLAKRLFISLSFRPSVGLSFSLSVFLSVDLSIFLSVCPSIDRRVNGTKLAKRRAFYFRAEP